MASRRPKTTRHTALHESPATILGLLLVLLGVATVIFDVIAANPFMAAIAALCLATIACRWLKKKPPPTTTDPFVRFSPTPAHPPVEPTAVATIIVGRPASTTAPSGSPYEQLYTDGLATITACDRIMPQKIMNKGESQIFLGAIAALDILKPQTKDWHVHAQPSLGELLAVQCPDCTYNRYRALQRRCDSCHAVYKALNVKRPDLVVCNNYGWPLLVIEYQGRDHIDRATPRRERESLMRNRVKQLAIQKAGIALLETPDKNHPRRSLHHDRRASASNHRRAPPH